MATIIRRGTIAELPEGEAPVRLADWKGAPGVLLTTADDIRRIVDHLGSLSLIAIEFPQFTDGRGYSMARLLRERYGFKGEIRAVGEVVQDTLFYLQRCGFDGFVLENEADSSAALTRLGDFSEAYQASVERPQPLFSRRAA
jgi:uncharacterized protein (DUF934 family)